MIYRPEQFSVVRVRKWSLTANDSGPQMILKLYGKWSRTGNDPNIGPQVIKDKNEEWYAFILEEGENKYKKLWKTLSYL